MTHLDEGQILTLRDAPDQATASDSDHLRGCPTCAALLDEARRRSDEVAMALGTLDGGPWDTAGAREAIRDRVTARSAEAAGAVPLPGRKTRSGRPAAWALSRAAGLLLVTAAGLSALPGSPVRQWLAARGEPTAAVPSLSPTEGGAALAEVAGEAGVRIPVPAGPLSMILRDAAPGTRIRVSWIPGNEAAMFAPPGSRFTSGQGRVEASLVAGDVRVELPRSILPASLEVNGRMLLRNSAMGLEITGPVVERAENVITFRLPSR